MDFSFFEVFVIFLLNYVSYSPTALLGLCNQSSLNTFTSTLTDWPVKCSLAHANHLEANKRLKETLINMQIMTPNQWARAGTAWPPKGGSHQLEHRNLSGNSCSIPACVWFGKMHLAHRWLSQMVFGTYCSFQAGHSLPMPLARKHNVLRHLEVHMDIDLHNQVSEKDSASFPCLDCLSPKWETQTESEALLA